MRISFVTVQYNNPDDTPKLVSSIGSLSEVEGCDIVVVDNSTSSDTKADPAKLQPLAPVPVEVLCPGKNLYYWGGAAFAIQRMSAMGNLLPEWIAVCNNDVTIEDPLFIRKIRSLDPRAFPIVAPRITSSSGKEQNPFLESSPAFLKRLKWRIYDTDYRIAQSMLSVYKAIPGTNAQKPRDTIEHPRRIYSPHGSFVLLSSEFFRRGGTLDTTVPLFAEELTISVTAARLGLPVWYYPDLRVLHREHSTTGHHLTREKYEFERRAHKRYYSLLKGLTDGA